MTSEITYWNNDAANYDKRAKKSHEAYQTIIKLIKNEISTDMDVFDKIISKQNIKNIMPIIYMTTSK